MVALLKSQSDGDEPLQQLVLAITRTLVDDTEAVEAECFEEDGETMLNVRVAPGDIGKIIGKQGRTARSLRTILSAAGMKLRRCYALNIEEESTDDRPHPSSIP